MKSLRDPILQRFLKDIGPVAHTIEAIYVFGSRATGRARPDSDYDLLVVAKDAFSLREKDFLYEIVMDVLLETGRLVSLKIFPTPTFQRLRTLRTPFMQHVLTEGVKVG